MNMQRAVCSSPSLKRRCSTTASVPFGRGLLFKVPRRSETEWVFKRRQPIKHLILAVEDEELLQGDVGGSLVPHGDEFSTGS